MGPSRRTSHRPGRGHRAYNGLVSRVRPAGPGFQDDAGCPRRHPDGPAPVVPLMPRSTGRDVPRRRYRCIREKHVLCSRRCGPRPRPREPGPPRSAVRAAEKRPPSTTATRSAFGMASSGRWETCTMLVGRRPRRGPGRRGMPCEHRRRVPAAGSSTNITDGPWRAHGRG